MIKYFFYYIVACYIINIFVKLLNICLWQSILIMVWFILVLSFSYNLITVYILCKKISMFNIYIAIITS